MEQITISNESVSKLLRDLKPSKSAGPDDIHPRVLKELAPELSTPLTLIFRSSLSTGKIPHSWKSANITAIYKKGDKKDPSNYRPVSLTSVVCKILEKIIRDHIIDHFKKNNLISNSQFGFLSGRSTVIQMLQVMDDWTNYVDQGKSVDVIYMDFMKAFDKVPHKHLIHKLNNFEVHEQVINWIQDFLSDRTQVVRYNGITSNTEPVLSGIPQGTVIGPVSFLSFINDLPDEVLSRIFLFADDTKLYRAINNSADVQLLQSDLNKLDMWSKKWHLQFHPAKCMLMSLGRSQLLSKYTMTDNSGNEIYLQRSITERDLGIMIDCSLNFSEHICKITHKANSIMAVIRRTFTQLDCQCFIILFKALVRPHLEYGVPIWFPYKMKDIEEVEKVQRRATKQVKSLHGLSYEQRLRKLNLPTLRYRRHRGDMIEVYKILHGIYDRAISEGILHLAQDSRTRGHSFKLVTQPCKMEIRRNCFSVRVVKPWNSLPEFVVSSTTVQMFESRLDKVWSNQPVRFCYKEELRL